MMDIKIFFTENESNIKYYSTSYQKPTEKLIKCDNCGMVLSSRGFTYVVKKLSEFGLLTEDYKKLCCECYYLVNTIKMDKCPICGNRTDLYSIILRDKPQVIVYCSKCEKVLKEIRSEDDVHK